MPKPAGQLVVEHMQALRGAAMRYAAARKKHGANSPEGEAAEKELYRCALAFAAAQLIKDAG